ncbi:MAG: amylo-alpha-1,6-glucosidase [Geminicoccaceae bacterium]
MTGRPEDVAAGGGSTGEARTPSRLFALKHGDTFIVADAFGDVLGEGDGLFCEDTRLLSRWRLTAGGRPLALLAGAVGEDNVLFSANLTNRPLPPIGGQSLQEGVIHVERSRLIWHGRLHERLRLRNYARVEARLPLRLEFAADFRDMFEVRGLARLKRGTMLPAVVGPDRVELAYVGLDGLRLATVVAFATAPGRLAAGQAEYELTLAANERRDLFIEVGLGPGDAPPSRLRYRAASARARFAARAERRRGGPVRSSGRLFNEWLDRSRADLALLTTEMPTGPYPYAGIPWFSTAFGRDAIITALQTLWLDPALARGVLRYLAAQQATETSPFFDAAPGKIMHETRKGEMARLHELPFGKYYGGVDATPLFVMLAGAYASRTGDLGLIEELWPALTAALGWIEGAGDGNGDGFLDYARAAATGLANQGWKDSEDSVFHADGSDATGPIALIEVQGYVFAAFGAMAELCRRRGEAAAGEVWAAKARRLQAAVEERFWLEDLGTYALALDGNGRPCRVRASNAGHLLLCGLPAPERAARVAAQLLAPAFNSGWGIRTLALGEARFNPMSYHNGSVWPHDTAFCAAGMARYGNRDGVARLLGELFETAVRFDMRLPELFCGFERRAGEPPIAYPVACLPQAWAAGAVFMLLQACLGLRIDGWRHEIHVDRPRLPTGIDRLDLGRLRVGRHEVALTFQRVGGRVVVYPIGDDPSPVPILVHA